MASDSKRLDVYTIIEKDNGQKSWWCRIGVAWVNRDGSINVILDATPVNGKLHIREPSQKDNASGGAEGDGRVTDDDVPF